MNETNVSLRHQQILQILSTGPLSRHQIAQKLSGIYPVSKPTLIRDLNDLVKAGKAQSTGNGKATLYKVAPTHPLLAPISLPTYFQQEPDQRIRAYTHFQFTVFNQLQNLFTSTQLQHITSTAKKFSHAESKLNPTILKRELERFVIELSWKSSKIEGNTYSLLETETLIKDHQEAKGKSRAEATMILNHKAAFDLILKHRLEFKTISQTDITQLHNVLVKDLQVSTGIRSQAVGISGTTYVPLKHQSEIALTLKKLIAVINGSHHALEKSLIALAMISYIQPFSDGNKRTARMLTNAILLAHDLYPLSYRSVDETEFKQALILFYETNNLYHLKRLLIDQFTFANNTYFV